MFRAGHYFYHPNPKNYFECAPPPVSEEMIWTSHFKMPLLKASQDGLLIWDEEGYELVANRPKGKVSNGYCMIQLTDVELGIRTGSAGRPRNKYAEGRNKGNRLVAQVNLIWEIHNQEPLAGRRVVHKNSNPFDFRKENLILFRGDMTAWRRNNMKFLTETVREMVKREEKALQMGMEPWEYFQDVLHIPRNILETWEKKRSYFDNGKGI